MLFNSASSNLNLTKNLDNYLSKLAYLMRVLTVLHSEKGN